MPDPTEEEIADEARKIREENLQRERDASQKQLQQDRDRSARFRDRQKAKCQ